MHPVHIEEMKCRVQPYLETAPPFQGRAVLLFGHCNASETLLEYLMQSGVYPTCFLDNNRDKQGLTFFGLTVFPPEKALDYPRGQSIVLIVSRFYHVMKAQLLELGYEDEILELVEYNSFQAFATTEEVFARKKERILRGNQLLQEKKKKYPHSFFVFCPHTALGDVYWSMSYLPAFCEKEGITSCVVFAVRGACVAVARLFAQDCLHGVEDVSATEMAELVAAVIFTQETSAFLAHHNYVYTDDSFRILSGHFMEFTQYYKEIVYSLPEDTKAVPPNCWDDFLKKEAMPQGKSVIIAPYANSVVELPLSFWKEQIARFQKEGLEVYTNIAPGQVALEHTKELSLPISQMIGAVEWAGTFMSIRSGLCDVVHSARCRKIVVFQPCSFSTTEHKISRFFALEGWETIER